MGGNRTFPLSAPKNDQKFIGHSTIIDKMQRILGATSTLAGAAIVAGVAIEFFTYDGEQNITRA